ncbi:MAG: UPF0175 family protein [Planctomycetaceae bacterium]|jgi:predicted HTH domain antitoxin|nr:UPF0175 family protein [Planctomycetaceae bacterium]
MTTLTLQLQLPDNFELSEHEAQTALVLKLYEDGKLTAGKGAAILGMTKREFIETFGTVIHDMTPEELQRDYENACRASRHLDKEQLKEKKEYALS